MPEFDPHKVPGANYMFPSSGDPDQDVLIGRGIIRREALLSEGICPNECGPYVDVDPSLRRCPVCHWEQHFGTLRSS